jgi:myo-inositol-1(or 4)-monophosphatase
MYCFDLWKKLKVFRKHNGCDMTEMTQNFITEYYAICETVSRKAGQILLDYFDQPLEIDFKGQYNMVTEADLASEKFILKMLKQLTPDIPVLSEEESESAGKKGNRNSGLEWIVDPLDGTTNFAHGFPHFCVSIALCNNKIPLLGVVLDPCRNELFGAMRGKGCTVNSQPCSVSGTSDLNHALIATGFPYKVRELTQNNLMEFCVFRLRTQGVRRIGAAALDLAYVAAGRLDGFWERWLKPWDTAAGILLVAEAGGYVSRFDGSDYLIDDTEIVAANVSIHETMVKILSADWPTLPVSLTDPIK